MSKKKKFIKFVCKTFDELKNQFVEKQKQYGTNDPLNNFRRGAKLKYGKANLNKMYQMALDYENKHVSHVFSHDITGSKIDESLKDIAVYSVIELYMLKMAKKRPKKSI